MPVKIIHEKCEKFQDKPCSELGLSRIGIMTDAPTGSQHLIGTVVVGGIQGQIYFLETGTWASNSLGYRCRDFIKGERVIFEGQ